MVANRSPQRSLGGQGGALDSPASGWSNAAVRFEVVTRATPTQVRHAFTDFSDRRPQTWDRTLDPRTYEVREQGDTWAVARESSARSPFWVVARYDWSDPDEVRWTVVESSYGGGGTGTVRISPGVDGGSRLQVQYDNTGGRALHRPLLFVLHHGPMGRIIAKLWTRTLDQYAAAEAR